MEDSYPYLPALENIKTSERDFWLMSAVFVPFAIVIGFTLGYLGFKYKEYLDNKTIVLLAIILVSILYLIIRMLLSYVSFKTDANGLTMRGVLSKKHLRWEEITSVWNKTSKLSSAKFLCVKTSKHTYKLGINSIEGAALITASVRQYLMPFGRADEIELDDTVKSLWIPVPDIVPEVISFGKAPSTRDKAFAWMGPVFFIMLGLWSTYFLFTGSLVSKGFGLWAWVMYSLLSKMNWSETMLKARSIKIDTTGIEAQCITGKVSINWDDVSSTSWLKKQLFINAENPKRSVGIEFVAGAKESESLFKAIIRNLRRSRNPQAVIMPQMVSVNPEILKRPAYTSEGQIQMQSAYINSLDEPARSVIRKLRNIQNGSVFSALFIGMAFAFFPILQNSIKYYQNGYAYNVKYFFAPTTMCFTISFFLIFAVAGDLISSRICRKYAAPYEKEWDEFRTVGSGGKKFIKWINITFALIVVLTIVQAVLCFSTFFKITDNNIVIGRFGSFKKEVYNWNEVRSITDRVSYRYVHGHTKENNTYIITFSNGNKWKNDSGSSLSGEKEMPQAMSFISNKSKVPIKVMYH